MSDKKLYFDRSLVQHALDIMERKHGYLSPVLNQPTYWQSWRLNGNEVLGYCDSPYPGPVGTPSAWISDEYVDDVHGSTITVVRSRDLTGSEVHLINEYLRAFQYNKNARRPVLISEVSEVLDHCIKHEVKTVRTFDYHIYWEERSRLMLYNFRIRPDQSINEPKN